MPTIAERAEAAVDDIVEDLWQRKILKWLFDENPDGAGDLWPGVKVISADVQDEIFAEWEAIIARHFTEPS